MKTVFLIRHAKSSWDDPNLDDHDRPLNKRGEKDGPKMAELFLEQFGEVDAIISSTALNIEGTDRVLHTSSLYCSMSREVHDVIRSLPDAYESVALFGHNPSFTSIANQFEGQVIPNIPTCGIVQIQSNINHWADWSARKGIIQAFIYPKMFKSV